MKDLLLKSAEVIQTGGLKEFARSSKNYLCWRTERWRHTLIGVISNIYYTPSEDPTSFMNEDWDNLIILDACRYDLFKQINSIDGIVSYKLSPASSTSEFLSTVVKENEFDDVVYVTSNPMYRTLDLEEVFHDVIDVWEYSWNSDIRTVMPEAMSEATVRTFKTYPNKRILSHWMQPHYPFIGPSAELIGDHAGFEHTVRKATNDYSGRDDPTVWKLLKNGETTVDAVWDAYAENLELALPYVEEAIETLDGKTVITSDHGNLIGERPVPLLGSVYGHPSGIKHNQLNQVPWLEVPYDNRRTITAGETTDHHSVPDEVVSERLADLGYRDV